MTVKHHRHPHADQSLAHSMTDLMTSLAVIFILLLVCYLSAKFGESQDFLKILKEKINRQIAHIDPDLKCEDVKGDPLSCVIRVKDQTLSFDLNSDMIRSPGKDFLNRLVPQLTGVICAIENRENVDSVFIQGFTDSTGQDEQNLELSQRRAFSVMRHSLSGTHLIPTHRQCLLALSSTNGRGQNEPILDRHHREDRNLSRRVEFKIRVKSGEQREVTEKAVLAEHP